MAAAKKTAREQPPAPSPDAEDTQEVKAKPVRKPSAKPKPVRAGGYIDRGDGRGWVLEKE